MIYIYRKKIGRAFGVAQERLSEEQRERIVRDAEKLIENPRAYNIFWANCEHTTNLVSGKQQFTSPEVHFFIWTDTSTYI